MLKNKNYVAGGVIAAAALAGAGFGFAHAGARAATTPTTVTAVTQVSNTPESPLWAYDNYTRTLTVTPDATASDCATAPKGFTGTWNFNAVTDTCYTATVADSGTFDAITGAATPNGSSTAKISHAVQGSMTGGASYILYAPSKDVLSSTAVKTAVDNSFGTGTAPYETADWPKAAFLTAAGVPDFANVVAGFSTDANGVQVWSWTYKTGCETWVDAATSNDGQDETDGNITGKICPTPPVAPYVHAGQWLSRSASRATVGWLDSDGGWPNKNNKCVQVYITGYGFAPIGDFAHAHIGFTCGTTGYLAGLKPDHTYALRIVPATGVYGAGKNSPIAGAPVGYVDVFTLADATELGLPLS